MFSGAWHALVGSKQWGSATNVIERVPWKEEEEEEI